MKPVMSNSINKNAYIEVEMLLIIAINDHYHKCNLAKIQTTWEQVYPDTSANCYNISLPTKICFIFALSFELGTF